MGVFDLLKGAFGGSDMSKKDMEDILKNEISFADAIAAHSGWKKRLDDYLANQSSEVLDPSVICQDNRCVLGKWIHGTGGNRFGQSPPFVTLRADHATFHYHAAQVIELHQAGETAMAREIMVKDYATASKKVIKALLALNQVFGERK